jgi:ABC-type nitrate/sulfonate/bicarbonate transport system ATPase subunit
MSSAGDAFDLDVVEKRHGRGADAAPVLHGVHLTARVGECLAVTGPSGVGKTTLLAILAGLDRDFVGTRRVAAAPVGMVFQEPRLLPWRTAAENVHLVRPEIGDAGAAALLARCGLPADHAGRHPGALSLGQQRRVALARALAVDPRLVLLDEPLVSLDADAVSGLRRVIDEVLASGRTTVVMVSHDVEDVLALADRVIRLDGRPATVAAEIRLEAPRPERDAAWRAARRESPDWSDPW